MNARVPEKEDLLWCIGPPLLESLSKLLPESPDSDLDRALGYYRERFSRVGLFENEIYSGITEMLRTLFEEGYNLFVASSKPEVFVRRILDHFELSPFFQNSYGSLLDGTYADKADLIAHVLREEELSANDSLMIGDRMHDVIGARANRVGTVGVFYGFGSEAELRDAGADHLVGSPEDLLSLLMKLK